MATDKKKARRQGAYLAVIDESGLLMAPLVRRTWAQRGQRPLLAQRSRHREKVSVAGAIWLSPLRDRLGLFFQTLVNGYFNNVRSAAFVEALVQHLKGRVVVVWDGGGMHKGGPIEELQWHLGNRLTLEAFPPYSPELVPVESTWSWLKYGRLCNFAPQNAHQLNERIIAELVAIRRSQKLLKGFFHASKLPLPRALLS